jgi:hypothetical protein
MLPGRSIAAREGEHEGAAKFSTGAPCVQRDIFIASIKALGQRGRQRATMRSFPKFQLETFFFGFRQLGNPVIALFFYNSEP